MFESDSSGSRKAPTRACAGCQSRFVFTGWSRQRLAKLLRRFKLLRDFRVFKINKRSLWFCNYV